MGSQSSPLPNSTSSSLSLLHPTEEEKKNTWTLNQPEWSGALNLANYLRREAYLATVPLSKNGGLIHWVLTDSEASPDSRQILSSCESLRKRALVATPDGKVEDVLAYGIGSVYTDPQFRGYRYASRMLGELAVKLREQEGKEGKQVAFSALWSDIGKTFYGKKGWKPYPSRHAAFPAAGEKVSNATPITNDNLEKFCVLDEKLLRQRLARPAANGKTRTAVIPDYDQIRWHLCREDFISSCVFPDAGDERAKPNVKGAVAGAEGRRVWAIWQRNYSALADQPDKNKLYFLRLVVEDETAPREEIVKAFREVVALAQKEAAKGALGKVELWNPEPALTEVIEKSDITHEWVDRETDSIPSLMWYGEGKADDIEWVGNEKYCWC